MTKDLTPKFFNRKKIKSAAIAIVKTVPRGLDVGSTTYGVSMIFIDINLIPKGPWLLIPIVVSGALTFIPIRKFKLLLEKYNHAAENAALIFQASHFLTEQIRLRHENLEELEFAEASVAVAATVVAVPWRYFVEYKRSKNPEHKLSKPIYALNLLISPLFYVAAFEVILSIFSEGFEVLSKDIQFGLWFALAGIGLLNEILRRLKLPFEGKIKPFAKFNSTLTRFTHPPVKIVELIFKLGEELSIAAFLFELLNDIPVMIEQIQGHNDEDYLPLWYFIMISVPLTFVFSIYQTVHFYQHNIKRHPQKPGEAAPLLPDPESLPETEIVSEVVADILTAQAEDLPESFTDYPYIKSDEQEPDESTPALPESSTDYPHVARPNSPSIV